MFVSIVVVRALLAELQRSGISAKQMLAEFELPEAALLDLGTRVPLMKMTQIIGRALELSGDPGLGLTVGSRAPEHMLQILGHLVGASRSVREAHAEFRRYATLVEEGMTWELHEEGELASLVYVCPFPQSLETRYAAECALTLAFRLGAQFVTDPDERPVELRFTHGVPSYAQRYTQIFGCPVKFEQARNEIVFARSLLDATQLHADPTMCVVLRETADRMLRDIHGPRTMADRVRHRLQYEPDFVEIDGPRLARSLGLTYRSLRRRLADEGVSLSSLIDEQRCRVACEELARTDGSVKAVVELLGYSEPSAFYRAFRRWTGLTPLQYSRSQNEARRG